MTQTIKQQKRAEYMRKWRKINPIIKIKKSYNPWNKGLTKETDIRVKKISQSLKGRSMLEETKNKLSIIRKGRPSWRRGLTLNNEKYFIPRTTLNNKTIKKSHIVWCSQHENLPYVRKGCIIHHLDFNPKNNNPNNLLLLDNKTHIQYHNQISKMLKNKEDN